MPATGNNGNRVDYRFSISSLAYKTYYRIKAIEVNGSFFYSKVINVSKPLVVSSESFSVYPNPVTSDQVTMRLRNAEPGRYIFFILTSQGLHVKQKMIEHNGGDLVRQIELNGLTNGTYQLTLQSPSKKYSQKIIYVN